jgi:biotin carboxyl carrier protein
MKFWVKIESQEKRVNIEENQGTYVVEIDGKKCSVDCRTAGHTDYLSLIIDNKSYLVESAPLKVDEGKYYANVSGRRYNIDVLDERLLATRQAGVLSRDNGPYVLKSPMPGLIVDVRVKPGDVVRVGSAVVIMEAMKMQNELLSEANGIVRSVNVKSRDTVESQTPLVEIERTE